MKKLMTEGRRTIYFAAAVAALYGLGVFWGLPSALSAASDSPAPLGPLAFVAEYRDPSKSYVYPAVHQLLLVCVYAPVVGFLKLSGRLGSLSGQWPYGFADPTATFSAFILLGNLVSLSMSVGLLLLLRKLRPTESHSGWFAAVLTALGGVYTYYSRVANLDVPYLFWWVLAYVCLWRYLFGGLDSPDGDDGRDSPDDKGDARGGRRPGGRRLFELVFKPTGGRLLALAGVASALAVGTKDQAAGLVLGFGLVLLSVGRRGEAGGLLARVRAAALFSVALVVAYALVAVATNPWRWVRHVQFVTSDHVLPEYEQSARGQVLLLGRAVVRLSHVMSPAGLALGAAGFALLARARRHRELLALALPAAAYYVLIIARVRATEERYMLPVALALAVGAGVAVGAARAAGGGRRAWWARAAVFALAAVALAQQFALGFVPVTYTQLFDTLRALARDIGRVVPAGSPLLVVDMPSFNVPNRGVYERYRLMHPPGERLFPPSAHGENLFHPYDPAHSFVLAGSPTTETAWPGARSRWPDRDAELVARWTYPDWVKRNVYVPSVYEFYLFRRRQPPPPAQPPAP